MSLKQPMGQKVLTNVSVVRLKKGKLSFEIACYPNMVSAWRNGIEKDIDSVLQMDRVFKDVEQGEYASSKDLQKAFGNTNQQEVCMEILGKGEIQLSEKERSAQQDSLLKEICTMIAEKCINPQSKRPVTIGVVERALSELHFNAVITKPAKKQALEAIKLLEGKYPIERAPMSLKLTFPLKEKEQVRAQVIALEASIESEDEKNGMYSVVFKIHPEKYRECDSLAREYKEDGGTIEVLQLTVSQEGDASLESQKPAHSSSSAAPSSSDAAPPVRAAPADPAKPSEGFKSTTAPGVVFNTREELAVHSRSDWHRHNLKLKAAGQPLLTDRKSVV